MPKIEDDGKSWLRRPKLYKRVVEPQKKKKKEEEEKEENNNNNNNNNALSLFSIFYCALMYSVYNFGAFAVKTAKINLFVKLWLSVCNNLRTTEKMS